MAMPTLEHKADNGDAQHRPFSHTITSRPDLPPSFEEINKEVAKLQSLSVEHMLRPVWLNIAVGVGIFLIGKKFWKAVD